MSPVVLLIKKGNAASKVSNMFCIKVLSPYHAGIFQNGNLEYFQVATTPLPLYTWILTADPTPG